MVLKEDYGKREFCNDIKCPVQVEMNGHEPGSEGYAALRGICSNACLQSAGNFLQWLDSHGYSVVKSENGAHDEDFLKNACEKENTAWLLHRALSEQGFVIVKK